MSYNKKALFFSQLGLGDNFNNMGAINFLLQYYDTIYFVVRFNNIDNLNLIFINKPVILIPIWYNNDIRDFSVILNNHPDCDVFISSEQFTKHFKSKITHPELLKYEQNNKGYKVHNFYHNIYNSYYNIGLDLSIYYDYFDIIGNDTSLEYYNKIKDYKILFMHTKASDAELSLSHVIDLYIGNIDYIIICANKNVYDVNDPKYNLANIFINLPIIYYFDIIKNADRIHVLNSCFECICGQLITTGKIKPLEYKPYNRYTGCVDVLNKSNVGGYSKYISHIDKSFDDANDNISKINKDILDIDQLNGDKLKYFYNNLIGTNDAKMLNIGKGSSICSILYKNQAKICMLVNSDADYYQQLYINIHKYAENNSVCVLDQYKSHVSMNIKFNIYMHDGDIVNNIYTHNSHYDMLYKYYKEMEDTFIFIAEDWNRIDVRDGVNNAIDKLNLNILYKREIRLTFNNKPTPEPLASETWGNGIYVAILQKNP